MNEIFELYILKNISKSEAENARTKQHGIFTNRLKHTSFIFILSHYYSL